VSGAIAMVLKNWTDCLCQVISGRTHIRIRSPRWTASSFWVYAGKGSRQIRSVTLEKGLAQRVTGDFYWVWWAIWFANGLWWFAAALLTTSDALDLLLTLNW